MSSSLLLVSGKRPRVGSPAYVELEGLSASARKPGIGNKSSEHMMPTLGIVLVIYEDRSPSFQVSAYR